jgi:hypothetical protein
MPMQQWEHGNKPDEPGPHNSSSWGINVTSTVPWVPAAAAVASAAAAVASPPASPAAATTPRGPAPPCPCLSRVQPATPGQGLVPACESRPGFYRVTL